MPNEIQKDCDHPRIIREHAGMAGWTGDYVCEECKALFTAGEKVRIDATRARKAKASTS